MVSYEVELSNLTNKLDYKSKQLCDLFYLSLLHDSYSKKMYFDLDNNQIKQIAEYAFLKDHLEKTDIYNLFKLNLRNSFLFPTSKIKKLHNKIKNSTQLFYYNYGLDKISINKTIFLFSVDKNLLCEIKKINESKYYVKISDKNFYFKDGYDKSFYTQLYFTELENFYNLFLKESYKTINSRIFSKLIQQYEYV